MAEHLPEAASMLQQRLRVSGAFVHVQPSELYSVGDVSYTPNRP